LKARVERKIGAAVLSIETGELAKQASGSCLVQYGDTVVLVAATGGPPRPGITDFFPLTCDYRERVAAAGKFPGGFLKREGRPTTKEVLTSRLIDRPIRPLFPKGYRDEVQVMSFVLASDRQNDADVLAMNGASAALALSPLPFAGPIAAVRLGSIGGQWVPFPTHDQLEESDLDLVVAGNRQSILMIEGFAREIPESRMADAIMTAHEIIKEICGLQEELAAQAGVKKPAYEPPPADGLCDKLKEKYYDAFRAAKRTEGKQARAEACKALKQQAAAETVVPGVEPAIAPEAFDIAWHELEAHVVRDLILAGTRPDGRDYRTLRPIACRVDLLPRVHGSALFQRGETQSLATVTLGTGRDEQRVDGLVEEYAQKFMLHYYFPSFSVGECRPIRGPGRREIGHGALAERSVKAVLPDPERFPYTIRVISDILESNGSSSMASVCSATLSLMAAGVPISNPVAGISVGLVQEADRYVLLTDIIGDEDHFGDMDFKVAGTQNGVTGIQLDLKIAGISEEVVRNTLVQARDARIEILRRMLTAISRPRPEISKWAPRLLRTKIDPEKIGLLIGPGGKTIRSIQEATGAMIDVEDDGTVVVASNDAEGAQEAMRRIEALTASVEIGKIYDGRVISIKDFGAFIEILPGKDGLCHISELADDYVSSVSDVCKIGDPMKVKVISVDDQDRVKLSRKQAMRELGLAAPAPPRRENGGGERGDRDRGDRDRGDRGDRGGRDRGGRDRDRGRDR
jgi:polyribonucleotide nucleotidyltransferase